MKTTNSKIFTIISFLGAIFLLNACSDKKPFDEFITEQFPEMNNMSDDISIDGELAVPILNSYFTLQNFIPSLDSTLWAEVDDNNLVHLRMYFKNIVTMTAEEIYGFPIISPIQPDSNSISSDTSKLKIYENALSGHLFFNDPRFTFIIKNEIPIVTFFKLDTLRLISPAFDSTFVRDDKKYYINAPTQPFTSERTEIHIDKTEIPDFEEFFSPIPKFASFYVTVGSDEVQMLPVTFPAVTGNEKLTLDVDVNLPLDVRLEDLILGDTVNFSIDTNIEQIDTVKIKLILDNDFPFDGLTQVSFADTNNHGGIDDIIMNLFKDDGWHFESSITGPNGQTTSSVRSSITITLTQEQIKLLSIHHASKVIVTSTLNSYQSSTGQDVKIFGWYQLGIKLGIKVSVSGNTGDVPQ